MQVKPTFLTTAGLALAAALVVTLAGAGPVQASVEAPSPSPSLQPVAPSASPSPSGPASVPTPAASPTTAPTAPAVVEVPRATKTVKTTRTTVALKVRSGAGAGYRALKVFPKGTAVSVGGASGAWSKVTALKTTGWVKTKYLSTTTATVTIPNYRYTKTTVPVHKAVGGRGGTLVVLDARTKVELLAVSGDWAKVKTGKNVGWVKLSVLQASLPAAVVRYTEAAVGIRSAAGSNTVVAILPANTRVEVLAASGSWSKVADGSKSGWIRTTLLSTDPVKAPSQHRWTKHRVNLRAGKSTDAKSLGVVPAWGKVTYHLASGAWTYVTSSKGEGWVKSSYLSATPNYPVAVYGTLRKGQSAYFLLKGKTASETKTRIVGHDLYLKPKVSWWSYLVPSSRPSRQVVAEIMTIKNDHYTSTVAALDSWERFDPSKPLADQNYNRKLVTDKDGKKVYAYVAGSKIAAWVRSKGTRVTSGDYLRR